MLDSNSTWQFVFHQHGGQTVVPDIGVNVHQMNLVIWLQQPCEVWLPKFACAQQCLVQLEAGITTLLSRPCWWHVPNSCALRVPRRPNLDHVLRGDQRGIGNPSRPCQLTQRSKVIISSCALQVIVEEKEPATGSEIPLLLRVWPEFTDTFQSHLSRVCKSHWLSLSHLSHCHTGWHFQVNYYLLLPVTCNLIKAEMLFTGDT